jgi:ribonucleotide reductase beta subunit family protein with ferritin-like domain
MEAGELTQDLAATAEEERDLEERARPFLALYEHWERNQWSPLSIDFSVDRASYEALDPEAQEAFQWIFAHRFHAEFQVATVLAPFLFRAPDYETQLVFSTQIADEYRHMQSVLRVYEEVFGLTGVERIREIADAQLDQIATVLYAALDEKVKPLETSSDPDDFLTAVCAYHLVAEGVVARTAQTLVAGQYERYGAFPGLLEGQRRVGRDEARHIGIGVSYVRRRMAEDRDHAMEVVTDFVEYFAALADGLLETALADGMDEQVLSGYGVEAEGFYAEAMRFWQLRLRSIGYLDE